MQRTLSHPRKFSMIANRLVAKPQKAGPKTSTDRDPGIQLFFFLEHASQKRRRDATTKKKPSPPRENQAGVKNSSFS
jgi:hypothetical protein